MINSTIKKVLCTTLILAFTTQTTFAVQNYTVTKTTNENYSASSHVGKVENYSNSGSGIQTQPIIVTPAGAAMYDYNYYRPVTYQPVIQPLQTTNAATPQTMVQPVANTNTITYQPNIPPITTTNINPTPVYSGGVYYGNGGGNYNQAYNSQDIQAPQEYNKTTTTTEQCVDTREKADKIIDRGIKVVGTVAVVGAVAGLLVGWLNKK